MTISGAISIANKKFKCNAGGSIPFVDGDKTLSDILEVSANPDRQHNHLPKDHKLADITLYQRVLARADEIGESTMNQRFREEVRNEPNAANLTWRKAQNAMQKRNMRKNPPNPKSTDEFHEGLSNPKYPELGQNFKKKVTNTLGVIVALIFGNDYLMSQATNDKTFAFDGTFYTCPPLFYQIFTLFMILGNHFFPVLCILMLGKSFEDYWHVFCAIAELLPDFNPTECISDFEKAPRKVCKQLYPSLNITGCYAHYARAVFANIQKKGLSKLYSNKKEPSFKRWAKQVMAIVLLPPDMILAAFDRLLAVDFPHLPARDRANILEFKKYLRKTWMNQFTPEVLSVFGKENATNNGAESFHRLLKEDIKKHRPNHWTFVIKLAKILKDKENDFKRLLIHDEGQVYRERRTHVITALQVRRDAEAKLMSNELTPEQFLLAMSFHNQKQVSALQTQFRKDPSKIETDHTTPDLSEGTINENVCVICATVKRGIHAFFPCKHAVSCESCCQSLLLRDKPRCPYCDKKIDSFHSINLN